MNDEKSRGALFVNKRREKDSHPNYRGELTLTKDLLKQMVEQVKAGGEAKLSVAAWNKTSKGGLDYLSLSADKFVERSRKPAEDDPF